MDHVMDQAVQAALEKCNPDLLDVYGETDRTERLDAARMIPYLIDKRHFLKVEWRQLSVMDAMISLLEGLESPQQLLTQTCPRNPDGTARSRWKALKEQTRQSTEVTETLINTLQSRMEQIHTKQHTLTQLVHKLQNKKEKSEQLEKSLQQAHNALHVCEGQLTQLMAKSDAVLGHLGNWQLLKDELQGHVSATEEVMQCQLLSSNQSDLSIELRPRLCGSPSSNQLEPLQLSITWNDNDRFRLQVNPGTSGMIAESIDGRLSELSAALVEVMQRYTSQGEMLAEIQGLHSRFAIDWRPAQKLLLYLKSASVVCFLAVEDGYPVAGRAKLLTVRKDSQPMDAALLQPHKDDMSLTEWLTFLEASPII